MQSGREDPLEELYAIKFCDTETYRILQTAFRPSCMNRILVFEWHNRFKEGRESVRDDERCGMSKVGNTPEFRKRFLGKRPALFKSGQWHFQQDNIPFHHPILVTDYLTLMVIKAVPHPPYGPHPAPCDYWLLPKLTGCRYETIEMKEAVTKVIDTLTQEDFHGAFQKLLERYKCITAGGDYFEGN